MQFERGDTLAHYEIVSLLGKGGMGEVYRAADTKLGREVALKILPDEFTIDAERLARFQREGRVLASLSHPNIAAIFEIGSAQIATAAAPRTSSAEMPLPESARKEFHYIAMQLAEGEDLAQRMKRGPIPPDEAVAIAARIADALDAAHEKGIVHRDLKPANVMVDEDRGVKVLDFGLARAMETEEPNQDSSNSPTMIRAATQGGLILGTAGYMSPEQARGKRVDKRADIWSFGVVLWEMLTGKRLFEGETVSDTLASVLTKKPDLSELPAGTPSSVRWVLERCLERDPKKRLRDIGEARLALEDSSHAQDVIPEAAATGSPRNWHGGLAWTVCGLLLAALVLAGWKLWRPVATVPRPQFIERLSMLDAENLNADNGSSVAISGDGRIIVLVASDKEGRQLYLNRLDQLGTVPIPGTRGAVSPFFSPDDQWIGFFADGKLKKVATNGGAPLVLCDASTPRGGSWSEDGVIVFSPSIGAGLSMVSENGGTPETLTTLDDASGERSHRWPQFLPGGQSVLYMAQARGSNYEDANIRVVTLKDRKTKTIFAGGAYPRYVESGHLLFARQATLFAVPFDVGNLRTMGKPHPVVQQILSSTGNEATCDGSAQVSVSRDGIVVYREGTATSNLNRMMLLDRQGHPIATSAPGAYMAPSFSPDGKRIAVGLTSGARSDVWIWDTEKNTMNRLTFEGSSNVLPIWSPDGKEIAYSSIRPGKSGNVVNPFVRHADGSGVDRPLVLSDRGIFGSSGWLTSWSGNVLAYQAAAARTSADFDVYELPAAGAAKANPALFHGRSADLSPDGRWIAYQDAQNGEKNQVLVRTLGGGGEQYQVSRDGGALPHWTKDGREIVWINPIGYWAAAVESRGGSLTIGAPTPLFAEIYVVQDPVSAWDVSADGSRFVVLSSADNPGVDSKTVILQTNFFDQLGHLVPQSR